MVSIIVEVNKVLIQAVKRNIERFPGDFMFLLTKQEVTNLKSQFVTSSWGGRRYLPYAFTEQGIAMLSSVLNSEKYYWISLGGRFPIGGVDVSSVKSKNAKFFERKQAFVVSISIREVAVWRRELF